MLDSEQVAKSWSMRSRRQAGGTRKADRARAGTVLGIGALPVCGCDANCVTYTTLKPAPEAQASGGGWFRRAAPQGGPETAVGGTLGLAGVTQSSSFVNSDRSTGSSEIEPEKRGANSWATKHSGQPNKGCWKDVSARSPTLSPLRTPLAGTTANTCRCHHGPD